MIVLGNMLAVLPTFEPDSIDAIVTDPPYALAFMASTWDTFSDRRGSSGHAFQAAATAWCAAMLRVAKPGAYLLAFGGTRTYHRLTCAAEDAGWEVRDCLMWLFGSGFPKTQTALKPAYEPILLARKPVRGTVAANVATHGTGVLNIDGCRIAFASDDDKVDARPSSLGGAHESFASATSTGTFTKKDRSQRDPAAAQSPLGRWPANVLLDEAAAAALDVASGDLKSGDSPRVRYAPKFQHTYGDFQGAEVCDPIRPANRGGAARFFYTAKASRRERNAGLEGLPVGGRAERPGRQAVNNSAGSVNGSGQPVNGTGLRAPSPNTHPTVKPVALMRWLVRLVTPPGGRCLDPFMGSGTTGIACWHEGVAFVGIECDPASLAIAERRIGAVAPLLVEDEGGDHVRRD